MKINGPGQPPSPGVSGPEGPGTPEGIAQVKATIEPGKSFAEKVSGPRPAARPNEGPAKTERASATARTGDIAVSDLAADLKAGKLTPRAAIDKVLDRVVTRQIGSEAPAVVRDRVRAALQDAVENDPLLANKLRQLG